MLLLALSAWRWLAHVFTARQGQDLEARRRCVASRCAATLMTEADHWDQQQRLRVHREDTALRGRRAHRLDPPAVQSPHILFVARSLQHRISAERFRKALPPSGLAHPRLALQPATTLCLTGPTLQPNLNL
ncbi:hypothetical protein C8Q72DRAFT_342745 [Fomitopsis betulina]|nr:hypothetical protein C8Q72DRAFT_342745 [Fomitopsis betulina]